MNLVGIHLRDSGALVWVNPDQVIYVEPLVYRDGSHTLIRLTSGVILSVNGDPQEVARMLVGLP
jgi:hypothetical protein